MDQMLVWTFIHREVLRTRADRKPVDIIDIYEDNSSSLGLFRRVGGLLERARSWRVSGRSTCDTDGKRGCLPAEAIAVRARNPIAENVP